MIDRTDECGYQIHGDCAWRLIGGCYCLVDIDGNIHQVRTEPTAARGVNLALLNGGSNEHAD